VKYVHEKLNQSVYILALKAIFLSYSTHYVLIIDAAAMVVILVTLNPVHGKVYSIQVCDKVCQWFAAGQCFTLGNLVSSTNKTNCYDI